MLRNPADIGEAAFGKTRWTPVSPRRLPPRGRPAQSRRGYSGKDAPQEEWITIPVPALVNPALFEAAQEQLEENRRRARIPEKGSRYLLQGLLVCAKCGYAYHGRTNDERNAYYGCSGAMSLPRFGGQRWCWNKEVRMDQTNAAVWQEICRLLEEPERLEQEYRQIRIIFRVSPTPLPPSSEDTSHHWQHCGRRVNARTFHGHMRTPRLQEPATQGEQITCVGRKATQFFVPLSPLHPTEADNDKLFVDIDATTAGIEYLHRGPPVRSSLSIDGVVRSPVRCLPRIISSVRFPTEQQRVVRPGT